MRQTLKKPKGGKGEPVNCSGKLNEGVSGRLFGRDLPSEKEGFAFGPMGGRKKNEKTTGDKTE